MKEEPSFFKRLRARIMGARPKPLRPEGVYVAVEWIDLCQDEDQDFGLNQQAPMPLARRAALKGFDLESVREFYKPTRDN